MPESAEKLNKEAIAGRNPGSKIREKITSDQDTDQENLLRQKILRDAIKLHQKYLTKGENIPQDELSQIRNEVRRLPHPWQFKDNLRASVLDGQLDKWDGVEFAKILFDEYDLEIVKDAQAILKFTDFRVPSMAERAEKKMYFRVLIFEIHREFAKKVASIKAGSLSLAEAEKLEELRNTDRRVIEFISAGKDTHKNKEIRAEIVKDKLDPSIIKDEIELERLFMKTAKPKTRPEILVEIERVREEIENGWQLALNKKVEDAAQLIRNIIFLSAYINELEKDLEKKETETGGGEEAGEELSLEDRAQKLVGLFLEEQLSPEEFKRKFEEIQKEIKKEELEATQGALLREAKLNRENAEIKKRELDNMKPSSRDHKRLKKESDRLSQTADLQEWAAEQLKKKQLSNQSGKF